MPENDDMPLIDAEPLKGYEEELQIGRSKEFTSVMLHSFGHSMVQAPIDGVSEIVNKFAGKKVIPKIELVKEPEKAEISTPEWHAQKIGSGAGLIAAGLVIARLLRGRI